MSQLLCACLPTPEGTFDAPAFLRAFLAPKSVPVFACSSHSTFLALSTQQPPSQPCRPTPEGTFDAPAFLRAFLAPKSVPVFACSSHSTFLALSTQQPPSQPCRPE